jgi:hypothetical protein
VQKRKEEKIYESKEKACSLWIATGAVGKGKLKRKIIRYFFLPTKGIEPLSSNFFLKF